jgi:hypothetical protein
MERDEIETLVNDYREALLCEFIAKRTVTEMESELLATAYETGEIVGKNEGVRKIEIAAIVSRSIPLREAKAVAERAEAERRGLDALCQMMTAWLNSQ